MRCTLSQDLIDQAIAFHGHWCPGLAYGIRASEWVLTELCGRSRDEELVVLVETDMCAVDAIQCLTGCTFGKGNLVHKDYGKNAFTFFRRADGKAARLLIRPNLNPREHEKVAALNEKRRKTALSPDEEALLRETRDNMASWLMTAGLEEIFDIQPAEQPLPREARVVNSLICEACGESVMETRSRRYRAQTLCIPCFKGLVKR